jgi:hypothetical protein
MGEHPVARALGSGRPDRILMVMRSKTGSGDIYYFNFSSGESTWDHPCDDHFK